MSTRAWALRNLAAESGVLAISLAPLRPSSAGEDAGRGDARMTTLVQAGPVIDASDKRRRIFAIVGASSGNLVEWYDFYTYAFTAIYFASSFFPSGNQTTQLLITTRVFAAGFLMRPVGGYLFGWIADKHGRRTSMLISILVVCGGLLIS